MLRLMAVHADCLDVPPVINERSNGNVTLDVATFSFTVCFNSRIPSQYSSSSRLGCLCELFSSLCFNVVRTLRFRRIWIYRTDSFISHILNAISSPEHQRFVTLCRGIDLYTVENVKTAVFIRVFGRGNLRGSRALVLLWGTFPFLNIAGSRILSGEFELLLYLW